MIRTVGDIVVAFDCEWIPDASSVALLFPEGAMADDDKRLGLLWESNGATAENPHPFVRLMQSRVVSIAMLVRRVHPQATTEEDKVTLQLVGLPKNPQDKEARDESKIISSFMKSIERTQPQLVGFNSRNSDLRILAQRALALGIPAKTFLNRPEKPWLGQDYFGRDGDASIDLMELIAGTFTGRNATLNLHEAATLCGIPGKFGTHGDEVFAMWQKGQYREIVEYNCYDAITTYLLWLRLAWVSGRFTNQEYETEQERLREYLMGLAEEPETAFVEAYINEWDRLTEIKANVHPQ